MIILHILLRSILHSVTTTKGKLLVWVRLPYRKINILTRLCLFNLSDITLCLFPSYVIWVCWYCSLLLVVVFSQDDYTFVFEGYRKGDLYIVDFSSAPTVSTC